MTDNLTKSTKFDVLQYYFRKGYYNTARTLAQSALRNTRDAVFKLQYCLALTLQRHYGEALRNLEEISKDSAVGLAAVVASIHCQNQCEVPDVDALSVLESRLKMERKRAGDGALYHAANVSYHVGDFEKAREYCSGILANDRTSPQGLLIKGWLEVRCGRLTKAADCFKTVLSRNNDGLDAAFGELRTLPPEEAISRLNQLIVKFPELTGPLIEKMEFALADRNWDEAGEMSSRIQAMDSNSIPAMQLSIARDICVKGNYRGAAEAGKNLAVEMDRQEPTSWQIPGDFAAFLSGICDNAAVSEAALEMTRKSCKIRANAQGWIEVGNLRFASGNLPEAVSCYKKAAGMDDEAVEALVGLTRCEIAKNGVTESVRKQVEFISEMYGSSPSASFFLLTAKMTEKSDEIEKFLRNAVDMKFKAAAAHRYGYKFLANLNAKFILDAFEEFPKFSDEAYRKKICEKILDYIPAFGKARVYLAKMEMDGNNLKEAERLLEDVVEKLYDSDDNMEANMMMARIHIERNNIEKASSRLQFCLSRNLNVKSEPTYNFLAGLVYGKRKNYKECLECMNLALNCQSERDNLKDSDLATLYVETSSSYRHLQRFPEAEEALSKASTLLKGTSQAHKVVVAQAELALCKSDVAQALALLSAVSQGPAYYEARSMMADIHLKYGKNKKKFVECYEELARASPTQENLIKLAEAYFQIRDIDNAVKTYEKAIEKQHNPKLCCKLGELYVKNHRYSKAVQNYKAAGTDGCLPLSKLLISLNQFEAAESALAGVSSPMERALLLSRIKEKTSSVTEALETLQTAYSKISENEEKFAKPLLVRMAECEASLHRYDMAIKHYTQALPHCENEREMLDAKLKLANLYLKINDWTSCNSLCGEILGKDEKNEEALLMRADIPLRQCDFMVAERDLDEILSNKPDHWKGLARMIEMKRRTSRLKEAVPYIEKAKVANGEHYGLFYCQGLYFVYANDRDLALENLHRSRLHGEWDFEAATRLIELYLGMDEIQRAKGILSEITCDSPEDETNRRLLENFVSLAEKDKQCWDVAVTNLAALASQDALRVGASYGLALGNMQMKQPERARNILKIVAKVAWQLEEAEYLERCWIMLVEHYFQSGKYEMGADLTKRIFSFNQGCAKAKEFAGILAERDQKYGEAAVHYAKAWQLNGEKDEVMGTRLAYAALKAKLYAETISACLTLMKKFPESDKIKKEVYEKALALLRT